MEPKKSIEVSGEDVEAAVAAGLEQLGVGPGDVLVEVLEEPSRGVFGIGAKQARVRLQLLKPPEPPKPAAPTQPEPAPVQSDVDYDDDRDDDDTDFADSEEISLEDQDDDAKVGSEVLGELLEQMQISGKIVVRRAASTRPGEEAPWLLDINGQDMNLLIGRRGETLNSLQYITRLIVSRRLQRRANIIVDAGGYKSKRSGRLRQLAERMANQAIQQGRPVSLEPMPPNERRIIHLTLRDNPAVTTESTGEGTSRKVTIIPK